MKTVLTLLAVAALFAGAAEARAPQVQSAELTLAAPAAKTDVIIDGAVWKCQESGSVTACRSALVDDMPAMRSCKRVVAVLGAVTTFSWRGKSLSEAEIAICNTRAK